MTEHNAHEGHRDIQNSDSNATQGEVAEHDKASGSASSRTFSPSSAEGAAALKSSRPRLAVIGVGGAGNNAVNNMINMNLTGVDFIAFNTDAQALESSAAGAKIQLGPETTQGLGAGSRPDVGKAAAEESMQEIQRHIEGANMVFVTAGMGGGTGSGAAPVIARAAKEAGILTVGVVTKPFNFEGMHRMRMAEYGIESMQEHVDTLIVIPNQNLFRLANEKTTFEEAFRMADDVLYAGVRGVTDLIVQPGLVNLDFADIRVVMSEMGKAMMGTGEAEGDRRSIEAAEAAISNPLLDDVSMRGARGVLINITGGKDMTLFEVDEAANRIREEVDPEANIIFGSALDETLAGKIRVSVVATGIDSTVDPSATKTVRSSAAMPGNRGNAAARAAAMTETGAPVQVERPVEATVSARDNAPAKGSTFWTSVFGSRPSRTQSPRPATAAQPHPMPTVARSAPGGVRPSSAGGSDDVSVPAFLRRSSGS